MNGEWFGDRAVRIALPQPDARLQVVAALRLAFPDCLVRAGMESVLVEGREPDPGLLDAVRSARVDVGAGPGPAPREVRFDVRYDGADLQEAADLLRLSAADLVAAHVSQAWQVAMMGFAPGFGYLVPHGDVVVDWSAVHRRASPRRSVPAGSVAVAAGMSAVYPATLPGGWQLLGTTVRMLFDAADHDDPTLLHPGDTVRFTEIR